MKKKKKVKPGPRGGTGGRAVHHVRYFDSEWHFIEAAAALTGLAPSTYIRRVSVAGARDMLEDAGLLEKVAPPTPPDPDTPTSDPDVTT